MNKQRFGIIILLILLFSCSKYTYIKQDGSIEKRSFLASDNSRKKDTSYIKDFDHAIINKTFNYSDSLFLYNLTSKDFQKIGNHFKYIILSLWYPKCPNTFYGEFIQIVDISNKIKQQNKTDSIAVIIASMSYDFYEIRNSCLKYNYTFPVFIIPSEQYGDKILFKYVNFIKTLCPECYSLYKDDISKYKVFLFNYQNKVITMHKLKYIKNSNRSELSDIDSILYYIQ